METRREASWFGLLSLGALLLAMDARAEKYAFLFGGSGEENNPKNFFIPDYNNLKKSLEAKGYKVVVLYDHRPAEVPGAAGPATGAGVDAKLAEYESKLKKGDQVMYIAHAHGADPRNIPMPQSPDRGLVGHGIGLDDGVYDSAKMVQSAKRLQKNGVTSAVMDLSCYSGNTQPDDPEGTCVISLASKSYVSVCAASGVTHSFTQGLIDAFNNPKLKSLEEAFLFSRARDRTPVNLPAISSYSNPYQSVFDSLLDETDPSSMQDRLRLAKAVRGGSCETVSPATSLATVKKLTQAWNKTQSAALESAVREVYGLRNSINRRLENLVKEPVAGPPLNQPGEPARIPPEYEKIIQKMNPIALSGLLNVLGSLRSREDVNGLGWATPGDKQLLAALVFHQDWVSGQLMYKLTVDPNWKAYVTQKSELEKKTQALLQSERQLYKTTFDRDRQKSGKKNPCSNYKL
jgi:hypothetical protein